MLPNSLTLKDSFMDHSLLPTQPMIAHLGFSHRDSPLELRESLHIEPQRREEILPPFTQNSCLSELLWVETCHRLELFCVSSDPRFYQEDTSPLYDMFLKFYPGQNKLNKEFLLKHSHYNTGTEAIQYLIKMVASLDSVVLGETQITHQFKRSLEHAHKIGTLGPLLHRLAQVALATSKKIRTSTSVGEKSLSLAGSALELAHNVFDNLSTCHIAILGAGTMAKLCCQYAASHHPKSLTILNRSPEKAQQLAAHYPQAYGGSLAELTETLKTADIILTCTASAKPLITYKHMSDQHPWRRKAQKHNLFLCDLSMPRNIDPKIAQLEDTYLFHVDDLKEVTRDHFEHRKQAALQAQPLLSTATKNYERWLQEMTWKPLLLDFHQKVQTITSKEVSTTAKKSAFQNTHTPHLEALGHSITQKLTAEFAQALKNHFVTQGHGPSSPTPLLPHQESSL